MQSFIVLGIIPGTNYQTTFNFWLGVAMVACLFFTLPLWFDVARRLRKYVLIRKIAYTINHLELSAA